MDQISGTTPAEPSTQDDSRPPDAGVYRWGCAGRGHYKGSQLRDRLEHEIRDVVAVRELDHIVERAIAQQVF